MNNGTTPTQSSKLHSFLEQSREADAIDIVKSINCSSYDRTAMEFAAKFGRTVVLEYLLEERKVGVEYFDLIIAAKHSQVEAFRYLEAKYESEPSRKDFDEIILVALNRSDQAFMEELIANPKFCNERILGYSCEFGRIEVVKKILATGVDPSVRNNKALREAFMSLSSDIVRLLLEYPNVRENKESVVDCIRILSNFEKGTRIPRDLIGQLQAILPEHLSLDDILVHIEAELY